jgi:DNA-binding winged helix-turn-helix (wHTH) protein
LRYRFGEYALDVDRRVFTRAGEPVHLAPKEFQLLQALVERSPKAASQQELYDLLWPQTFVQESNLHNLIYSLREALGDKQHRIIRTVYGYGFALELPVIRQEAEASCCSLLVQDREIQLREGENLVGRQPDCAVQIKSSSISRKHARIIVSDSTAVVEDLGSKNGTQVRGRRIRGRVTLEDGDEIVFGKVRAIFRSGALLTATETIA